jgi:hypothetical protein
LSSIGSSRDSPNKDGDTRSLPRPSALSFQDAHKIVANGQKMLQEWNRRWGSVTNFVFLEFGGIDMPADRARGELMAMIQDGRLALLQLESIASIDFKSIPSDDFRHFWIDAVRVVEGLHERIAIASALLQTHSDTQNRK